MDIVGCVVSEYVETARVSPVSPRGWMEILQDGILSKHPDILLVTLTRMYWLMESLVTMIGAISALILATVRVKDLMAW